MVQLDLISIRISLIVLLFIGVTSLAISGSKPEKNATNWEFITEYSDDLVLPGINPLKVRGNIITAGSSTVFPLTERIAERFRDEGFPGNISIDSIGTGAGFERFCISGETDIANSSREIKPKETDDCIAIGRNPIEIRVGTDALTVVVSKENSFAKNVSIHQLAELFSTAENWNDINPTWPDERIQRFIPGTDSGTFDYFVETVFKKDIKPILSAKNTQMSEDDNILVRGVVGSPYSVGFFGYAYYIENADTLTALTIDGIAASKESINNTSYTLSRPLNIYTTAEIMTQKPQVAAFINFYLSYVDQEVVDVGYFPANKDSMDEAKHLWLNATSGLF